MREPLQVEMGLLRDQFQIFNACDPVFFAIIKEVRTIKRENPLLGGIFSILHLFVLRVIRRSRSQSCQKGRSLRDLLETAGQDLDLF